MNSQVIYNILLRLVEEVENDAKSGYVFSHQLYADRYCNKIKFAIEKQSG